MTAGSPAEGVGDGTAAATDYHDLNQKENLAQTAESENDGGAEEQTGSTCAGTRAEPGQHQTRRLRLDVVPSVPSRGTERHVHLRARGRLGRDHVLIDRNIPVRTGACDDSSIADLKIPAASGTALGIAV